MAHYPKSKIINSASDNKKLSSIKNYLLEEDGFSMFELLTVMTLIGIFVAMVIPNYLGTIRAASLNTSANQIASDIRKAQARSMATGIRYGYKFTPGDANYLYVKDTGSEETVETRKLAKSVTVLDTSFPDGKVTFARSGAASQAGQVRIRYSDGTVKTINVVRITGKVRVQ